MEAHCLLENSIRQLQFWEPITFERYHFQSGYGPVSIAKIASKKIGALIRSMTFLSPEVALYLYKFTTL